MRCVCGLKTSVVDPQQVNADPDPACYFDASLDPTFHFDADPDPSFQIKLEKNLEIVLK